MTGRDGVRLSDYWSAGMRSLHGIHVHGFPNAFLVQLGQGGNFVANVPHNLTDTARTVAAVVSHMIDNKFDAVDVSTEAEDAWMELLAPNPVMTSFLANCTPGYYNNEGQGPSPHSAAGRLPARSRRPTSATSTSGAARVTSRDWNSAGP